MPESFSLPQTKQGLPTRGLKGSTQIWIKQIADRDSELWGNPQKLWILQNKLYDFTQFADSHPGGKQWIQLTKGQDITVHFITHHLNQQKARKLLEKYYIRPAQKPQQPRYSFKDNGLYMKVKAGLLAKYKPEQLQDWSKSVFNGLILLLTWTILLILCSFYQSYLLAALCGMAIFPLLGIAHNFIHRRHHFLRYLWLLTGFTHQQWERMHCLSHHAYPNTLLDYEIQALQPVIFYLKIKPKNKIIFGILKQVLFMIGSLANILLKIIVIPIAKRKIPQFYYLASTIQIPFIYILTHDWTASFKLYAIIQIFAFYTFMKLAFLGHRTGHQWTEGNEEFKDFAEHQIYASSDSTDQTTGLVSYILYGGFNVHAIHHLFPTIDNHMLPSANKILIQQTEKLGIKRNLNQSIMQGLIDVEANFYNRKEWRRA